MSSVIPVISRAQRNLVRAVMCTSLTISEIVV